MPKQIYNNYDENDIRHLIFENIDDKFSYGKYGDFNVVIMNKNGYINATKLCSLANKLYSQYSRTDNAKSLINTLARVLKEQKTPIYAKDLTIQILGGHNTEIQGTYVHQDLIHGIATWASDEFSIKIGKIIKGYYINLEKEKNTKIIRQKDDKIDQLHTKLDDLKEDNKEFKKDNKALLDDNKELMENTRIIINFNKSLIQKANKADQDHKNAEKQVAKLLSNQQKMNDKLDEANNNKVVPTGKKCDVNRFILVKNNSTNDNDYEYTAFRIQNKIVNRSLTDHRKKFKKMKIKVNISESPNSNNLWMRVRSRLESNFYKCNGRNFTLDDDYYERQLIKDINKIHDERFDDNDDSNSERSDGEESDNAKSDDEGSDSD